MTAHMIKRTKLKDLDKNFELTALEFDNLLFRLEEGDEQLFESVFLAQFKPAINYLKKRFHAEHELAYDTVMSTMTTFFTRLKAGKVKYGNLRYLFIQMLVQEYYRQSKKVWSFEEFDGVDIADDEDSQVQIMELFDQAFARLGEGCQTLLYAYYYDDLNYTDLSEKLGKSQVAVRKQKQRCLQQFKLLFRTILWKNPV